MKMNPFVRGAVFAMQISCESSCKDVPSPLFVMFRCPSMAGFAKKEAETANVDYMVINEL